MNFFPKSPPPLLLAQADMLHPHAASGEGVARGLTSGKPRTPASRADLAPQPLRPGAQAALGTPSRRGNRLHYRNGSVTDLQGKPLPTDNTPHPKRRNVVRQL